MNINDSLFLALTGAQEVTIFICPFPYLGRLQDDFTQVPSMTLFDKKMVRRCGVWQIKRMNSQDKDQVLMKSNMLGFGGYSQMKF